LYEECIALDPQFARAYALLGNSYCAQALNGWSQSPAKDLERAFELAQKAISLDQELFLPHETLGWYYLLKDKHDEAVAEARKAVDLLPSSSKTNIILAAFLAYADLPNEAIPVSQNALRLNPFPSDWDLGNVAYVYIVAERNGEALTYLKKMQKRNPDNMWSYLYQASIYGNLGREEEARAAAKELLRLNSKFSVENFGKLRWQKNRDKWNLFIDGLRKAGLT
jgi:adenylate cyclase